MRRRLLTSIAIALLLGALATVATAWVLAWVNPASLAFRYRQFVAGWSHAGAWSWATSCDRGAGWGSTLANCWRWEEAPETLYPGSGIVDDQLPWWSFARDRPDAVLDEPAAGVVLVQYVSGWPMPSMEWRYGTHIDESGDLVGDGLRFGWAPAGGDLLPVSIEPYWAFPLRPLWRGFVIDTALSAALAWLILFGPFALRRRWRRRHGRCPACGYVLNNATHDSGRVCPECGAPRPRAA